MSKVDLQRKSAYRELLSELTSNDRNRIQNLADVAIDNKQHAAAVADAIIDHIVMCPAALKLPALFLLDCIAKNYKSIYAPLFQKPLPLVCSAVGTALPAQRPTLDKVIRIWKQMNTFPPEVIAAVDKVVGSLPSTSQASATPALSGSGLAQHQVTVTALAGYYPPAGMHLAMQQQTMPVVYAQQPVVYTAQAPPAAQYTQPAVPASAAGATVPTRSATPPAVAATTAMPPVYQTSSLSQPMMLPTGPPPAFMHATAAPTVLGMLPQQHPQPAPSAAASDLFTLLARAVGGSSGGSELSSTSFSAQFIKDFHPEVLDELFRLSNETRPKLLDWQFLRRRRQKAATSASRNWYVKSNDWITGTIAADEATPSFLEEQETEPEPEKKHLVPVDDEQRCCAISGEEFDEVWDEANQVWAYADARRLEGEEASRYGVKEGAIVKVKCLAAGSSAAAARAPAAAALAAADTQEAGGAAGGQVKQEPGSPRSGRAAAAAAVTPGAAEAAGAAALGSSPLLEAQAAEQLVAIKGEPMEEEAAEGAAAKRRRDAEAEAAEMLDAAGLADGQAAGTAVVAGMGAAAEGSTEPSPKRIKTEPDS